MAARLLRASPAGFRRVEPIEASNGLPAKSTGDLHTKTPPRSGGVFCLVGAITGCREAGKWRHSAGFRIPPRVAGERRDLPGSPMRLGRSAGLFTAAVEDRVFSS
ncbi:hypothetical protein [Methyloraptor flagellatus]|uniref:Uncharacterized protein n=1 Tax=Methyloraptor flagellatus TaxID=3162530 RepID=A0AAU7X6Z9_9HYPH